ncbi:MAG TPA: hypothetical protein VK623_02685 [Flavobacterium sp.]|nr:hypothetical protein [Flavobacterium sp.]
MKETSATYKWQIYLAIAGLLFLSATCFVLQLAQQHFIFPDSNTYVTAAQKWYGSFSADETRPLLISMIEGFPLLFGFSVRAIFIWSVFVNAFCWILTMIMLFEILKTFLLPKHAFLFALAFMFCMGSTIIVFHLLAETVFTFFLFLVVFLTGKYIRSQQFWYLALALSMLVLSVLVKPASTILLVVYFLYFSWVLFKNRKKKSMLLVYASLFFLLLQMGLMYKQYGNFTVSYIDSFTYYNYLGTRADGLKSRAEFKQLDNERATYLNSLSLPEQKHEAAKDFINQFSHNTLNLVKAYGINVWHNSVKGSTSISECKNYNHTPYFETFRLLFKVLAKIQVLFFSICGTLLALYYLVKSYRKDIFFTFVSVVILYIVGISGISSEQGDRFHIVVYSFIIILLAKFLSEKTKTFRPDASIH